MSDRSLAPVPFRTLLVDPQTGMMTTPWIKWFLTDLYRRVGGGDAMPIDQLEAIIGQMQYDGASSSEEIKNAVSQLLSVMPDNVSRLEEKIKQLESKLSEIDNASVKIVNNSECPESSVSIFNHYESDPQYNEGFVHLYGTETVRGVKTFKDTTNVKQVQFDTTVSTPDYSAGLLFWDDFNKTLAFHAGLSATCQIGEELYIPATNKTGSIITEGQVVYINGAQGGNTTVELAKADSGTTTDSVIGIATENIAINGKGMITTFGLVHGLNTNAWSEGTQLYLSPTTAGGLTSTVPSYPNRILKIAIVARQHLTQGELLVQVGQPLDLTAVPSTQLAFGTTEGVLYGSSNLTWDGSSLSVPSITPTSLSTYNLPCVNASGVLDNSGFWYVAGSTTGYVGDYAGGNYTKFEGDGTLVCVGDATTYDDIQTPMMLGRNDTGANVPAMTTFSGNIKRLKFAVGDFLDVPGVELLHDWKEESTVEIHIHWATNGTDTTARYVKWEVEWTLANMEAAGGTIVFPTSTVSTSSDATIAANETSKTHKYTTVVSITMTGFKIGAYLLMRVRRVAATGTAPTNDPFGIAVGVHYLKDTLGSRTISSK